MNNIDPADVAQPCQEATLKFFDGNTRKIYYNDQEVPFPEGKLIVSRTDTAGIITHCNQAFVDMSGYEHGELIGQPQCILRHPDIPTSVFADVWGTLQSGKKWHGYLKNLRKDGRFYLVFAVMIPNFRDGKIVGFSSVRRRPSRKKMDDALQRYAEMRAQ